MSPPFDMGGFDDAVCEGDLDELSDARAPRDRHSVGIVVGLGLSVSAPCAVNGMPQEMLNDSVRSQALSAKIRDFSSHLH